MGMTPLEKVAAMNAARAAKRAAAAQSALKAKADRIRADLSGNPFVDPPQPVPATIPVPAAAPASVPPPAAPAPAAPSSSLSIGGYTARLVDALPPGSALRGSSKYGALDRLIQALALQPGQCARIDLPEGCCAKIDADRAAARTRVTARRLGWRISCRSTAEQGRATVWVQRLDDRQAMAA